MKPLANFGTSRNKKGTVSNSQSEIATVPFLFLDGLLLLVHENVIDGFAVRTDAALSDGSCFSVAGDFPFLDDELFTLEVTDPLDCVVVDTL